LGQYRKKAFDKYLKKIKASPWNSEEGYLEAQADYVKYLYMEMTPHYKPGDVARIKQDAFEALKKEREDMKAMYETTKKRLEEEGNKQLEERREELRQMLLDRTRVVDKPSDGSKDPADGESSK
jgi:hypothetical protein